MISWIQVPLTAGMVSIITSPYKNWWPWEVLVYRWWADQWSSWVVDLFLHFLVPCYLLLATWRTFFTTPGRVDYVLAITWGLLFNAWVFTVEF